MKKSFKLWSRDGIVDVYAEQKWVHPISQIFRCLECRVSGIQKKHILNTCDKKSIEMANVHQNLGFFLETIKVKLYIVFW